jgi:6-phosphogluconolactonase (cycloisomerase 2 family)
MRARSFSALFGVIAFFMAGVAAFLSGCASGHKQFVYVVGPGTNEVFEFRAERTGTLAPLGTPHFAVGSNPVSLAAHTSGDFLYIADFSGNDVTQLDINKSNGNLSVPATTSIVVPVNPPNIFPTGNAPASVAMSPTGPFLFVANQLSGDISSYTVDPGSGSLTPKALTLVVAPPPSPAPPPPVSNPNSIAVSPKGDLLFVANPVQGTVAVLTIDAKGVLGYAAGSPFSMGAGATPAQLAVEHTGKFLYVTDPAHNAVLGFAIQGGGALSPINGSPFIAGAQPSGLAIDSQGALLYVANKGSNNVSGFAIDANSGSLGAISGSPFATGGVAPAAVAVDSTTSFVYVGEQGSHDVAAFTIGGNGALKPVAGSPFGAATAAISIVVVRR